MTPEVQTAIDRFREHRILHLDALAEWLAIPSISTDPAHDCDLRRAADWAAVYLTRIGCRDVELLGPESHPAVYGEFRCAAQGVPVVLVYGHYDVQPTDPDDEWSSDPFVPTVRGDSLYARGAADMKGPAFSALASLESLVAAGSGPRFDVKLLFEGEEEIGSPHLEALIAEHRERLRCDVCLNLDAGMLAPGHPTLSVSVRGIAAFELRISGPAQDLHSGEYGGVVHNPAQVLCELIAGLHDEQGRVTLPGFYDRVRELDDGERAQLGRLPVDERFFLDRAGVPALWGEVGYSVLERIGSRPTLDIHGLDSGFTGGGSKTIVPATASAKLSTRLVPDQDPSEVRGQLETYLRDHAPATVCWQLDQLGAVPPAESDVDSPWSRRMLGALRSTWTCEPLIKRVGGTIPIVPLLERTLGVDSVNAGWALPDGNLHAPNENLHLPTLCKGVESLIRFFGDEAGCS